MNIIKGNDSVFEVMSGASYKPFVCMTDFSLDVTTEYASVRTVTHGRWDVSRAELLRYAITINVLAPYPDATKVDSFNALRQQVAMTEFEFRIIYNDATPTLVQVITGRCLPVNTNLAAPVGFLRGVHSFVGNGEPSIENTLTPCSGTIGSASRSALPVLETPPNLNTYLISYSGVSDGVIRIDWTVDGGDRFTEFLNGTSGNFQVTVVEDVQHTLILYPVCVNGADGTPYQLIFTG